MNRRIIAAMRLAAVAAFQWQARSTLNPPHQQTHHIGLEVKQLPRPSSVKGQ